jgi:ABC-type lipoprotein release transport system permease subunit
MLAFLKMAARNLRRNRKRTIITVLAITGGLALTVWANNLNHGMWTKMVKIGVSTQAGHVVVQGEGYQADPDIEIVVSDGDAVAEAMVAARPDAVVLQRTWVQGLLSSSANSIGVGVQAIQPDLEAQVTDWQDRLVEGAWLEPGDDRGIIIGVTLAETLDVTIGKKVVLMGQGAEDVSSRLFRVRGITRTGAPSMDARLAFIDLSAAREFTGLPGASSQVSLHLPRPEQTPDALAAVEGALAGREGLEILPWQEAASDILAFTQRDRQTNNTMMFIIGLIVAIGILNTILMSVMERMKEFGVMLALGMEPGKMARLIAAEGFLIGLMGAVLGTAIGVLGTWPMITHGLDYTSIMGETIEMEGIAIDAHMFSAWDWTSMTAYAIVAVLLAVSATLYPAWKASRLKPVDAMRHV